MFIYNILLPFQMYGNCSCRTNVIGQKCDMCSANFFDVTRSCLGMINIKYEAMLLLSVNHSFLGTLPARRGRGGGWGFLFYVILRLFIAEPNYVKYGLYFSGHSVFRSFLF